MSSQQSASGVTLLELILVLAIMGSLLAYSVRIYQQFQFQAYEQQIAGNVNQLFQALEGFYYVNCREKIDQNFNAQTPGLLDPNRAATASIVIPINSYLIARGYLPSTWKAFNPLLDNSPTQTDKGYYAQFNRALAGGNDPMMSVYACNGDTEFPSCSSKTPSIKPTSGSILEANAPIEPTGQSHVVIWVSQVAVKMSKSFSQAQWTQLKNDLSADCISIAGSGGDITPCTPTPTPTPPDEYLVWTRMPSAYNPNISSDYWLSNPYVKQFNQQYTNDTMGTLSGVVSQTQSAPNWYNPLNFLCGG